MSKQTIDGVPRDRMISGDLLERLTNAPSIRSHGEALDELRALLDAPAENVIDVSAVSWAAIQEAASESTWMPPEYMRNDWVDDVCRFLREGPVAQPQAEPVAKSKPVAKLHAERLTGKDGEYGITVEDSQWFNTCRLTGGEFYLYAEQHAPVTVVMPERIPEAEVETLFQEGKRVGWNGHADEVLRRIKP